MLKETDLRNSQEFKEWIGDDKVLLVHNTYWDSDEPFPAYIVVHTDNDGKSNKCSITRFWQSPNRKDQLDRIHVSADFQNLGLETLLTVLLEEYSRGLA